MTDAVKPLSKTRWWRLPMPEVTARIAALEADLERVRELEAEVRKTTVRAVEVFKALVERLRKTDGMNHHSWDAMGQDVLRSIAALEVLAALSTSPAPEKAKCQEPGCDLLTHVGDHLAKDWTTWPQEPSRAKDAP